MKRGKKYKSTTGRSITTFTSDDRFYVGVADSPELPLRSIASSLDVQQADELATELAAWAHARRVEQAIAQGAPQ